MARKIIYPKLPDELGRLVDSARPYYDNSLPYHNWEHAREVVANFHHIWMECIGGKDKAGPSREVDYFLGIVASAFHDAGWNDPNAQDYPTKEHYAAHITRRVLASALDKEQLNSIEDAILATRYAVDRPTKLGKVLHYADVWNMGSKDYDDFFDHSIRLWGDHGKPDWAGFKQGSKRVIETTIDEALGPNDIVSMISSWGGDPYGFVIGARANLERFMDESRPEA